MTQGPFDRLNEEMFERLLDLNPGLATTLGRHVPYDNLLPHGGFETLSKTYGLLKDWRGKARKASEREDLSVDQDLGLRNLDFGVDLYRFSIEEYPMWKMNPDAVEVPGDLLFLMITRDYAPLETRLGSIVARLSAVPTYLKQFRTRIETGMQVRLWTEMAIESTELFPEFLDFISAQASEGVAPQLKASLDDAVGATKAALVEQVDWLNGLLDTAVDDFAMGRERFDELVRIRNLGFSPDEMLVMGERYLRELSEQRAEVARRIAPGADIAEAVRIVQEDSPRTFEEGLASTKEEMEKARRYLVDKGIATVDPDAKLAVVETPRFMASVLPYAALQMPCKFEEGKRGEYMLTRPKDPRDIGSHLNRGSILNTAVHEAFPGHFHQGIESDKRHWMLQLSEILAVNDIQSIAAETVEGWAHYCEKMMYDHGYGTSDPAVFEMINGAIFRAFRIIADVRLARGDATVDEMVDMAVEVAGLPRDAATAEVRRYSKTPGQPLSYLVGRHIIIDFRRRLEEEMGERFDERRFHDLLASYGYLPISLALEGVRRGMSNS
jgi:uncharacterized protein (DUF885 family)